MIEFRSNTLIALGGNLPFDVGSPEQTLVRAIEKLRGPNTLVRSVSRFYATPCFPAGAGPDYVNAAVSVDNDLSPTAFLNLLHDIEHIFGRARTQRWGMRTLDLDVLGIGQTVLPDATLQRQWQNLAPEAQIKSTPDQLIVPHPRIQDRAFVLVPLVDIAPDWRHPVLNKTALELYRQLPQAEIDAVRPL